MDSWLDAAMTQPEPGDAPAAPAGVSTPGDLEAVGSLFNELAVGYVAQVRDVMLELRFGEAEPSWIELTRPALRSLQTMATKVELGELCRALDEFCAAVDTLVVGHAQIGDAAKAELLRCYKRLSELNPQAFELGAERDRREPIIVEALLRQVDRVERLTIDKLFAVGLNRLEVLVSANAQEVVAVTGIELEIATAILHKFRSYKAAKPAVVSVRDPVAERRELAELLATLSAQNADFVRVCSAWAEDVRGRKRELRKEREQTFQQIKVVLARLGERDRLAQLEKLPFAERITTLDRFMSAAQQT